MKIFGRTAAAAFAVAMFAAGPALAVTVTNQSDKAHEVVIDLGATEPTSKVDAGKSAKMDCPEGCELRVMGAPSYGLAATKGDKVVIGKDGMMAHEGQMTEARTEKPSKSKTKTD